MSFGAELLAAVKSVPAEVVSIEEKVTAEITTIAKDVDAVMPTVKSITNFVAQFVPGAKVAVVAETGLQEVVDGVDALLTAHAASPGDPASTLNSIMTLWNTLKADWAKVKGAV